MQITGAQVVTVVQPDPLLPELLDIEYGPNRGRDLRRPVRLGHREIEEALV